MAAASCSYTPCNEASQLRVPVDQVDEVFLKLLDTVVCKIVYRNTPPHHTTQTTMTTTRAVLMCGEARHHEQQNLCQGVARVAEICVDR